MSHVDTVPSDASIWNERSQIRGILISPALLQNILARLDLVRPQGRKSGRPRFAGTRNI